MAKSTKLVTLKLPSDILKRLPQFETPKKKRTSSSSVPNIKVENEDSTQESKAKKPSAPSVNAKNKKIDASSPTPQNQTPEKTPVPSTSNNKPIPSKPSTNPEEGTKEKTDPKKLDKTGNQVRKWKKAPLQIQTFTGYNIEFKSWTGGVKETESDVKEELENDKVIDKSSSLKIQIKLKNKNLDLIRDDEDYEGSESRDQSPGLDDASSVLSTPDISRVSTPLPH